MTVRPISGAELLQLERADYRRVTLLTTWSLIALYVLFDLLLRWGEAHAIAAIRLLDTSLPSSGFWQTTLFVGAALGTWLLFYVLDDTFEAAGARSLCYRLGNLTYTRGFSAVYLCALLAAGTIALQYQIADVSFWLLLALMIVSCLISFVERGVELRERLSWNSMRLRLMLSRVPLLGRFVSLGPINAGVAAGIEQAQADDGSGPAPETRAEQALSADAPEQSPEPLA